MANRNFPCNKQYSFHVMPVQLDCQILIGASGAVTSFTGLGINAVTLLKAGVYQIQLQDNYASITGIDADMQAPGAGGAVTSGSFTVGTLYKITTLGTTNYNLIGIPAGITPAVGMPFVATGVGTGTGTAQPITNSGVGSIELIGSMLNNQPATPGNGGYVLIQTLGATSSSVTTEIPVNATSGSTIFLKIQLNNSSVQ